MNRTERQARVEELRQWIQAQHDEFRDEGFPSDVQAQWDLNNTELREHERVLAELDARDARLQEIARSEDSSQREAGEPTLTPRRAPALIQRMSEGEVYDLREVRHSPFAPERAAGEIRERALRAVELSHFPAAGRDQEAVREHVSSLIRRAESEDYSSSEVARRVLATGSPSYKRAFAKMLSAQMRGVAGMVSLTPDEARAVDAVRALAVGTGSAGGFAVPYQLDPTIVPTSNRSVNPLRRIASVETIAGTNEWRGLTSAGVTAGYAAEATEASDNSPTFGNPTLTTVRAQCFVPVSIELTQDWGAVEAGLSTLIQDAKDDLEATKFLSGSGTNEPFGLLTGATTTVASGAVATYAVGDLYKTEEALGARFRTRAQWVAARGIYNKVRQFDTAGGANLWVYLPQGLANDQQGGNTGAELIGYAANELSTMVSTTTTASKVMVFGDFRYYKIVDRIGMDVEVIPHLFGATNRFPTGQRGFYAYWRNTAKVLDANAFRVLTIA